MIRDDSDISALTLTADAAIVTLRLYVSIPEMTVVIDRRTVGERAGLQGGHIGPDGDCAVLRITGELDAYTAPFLRDRMRDLTAVGVRHVIADLRQVDFLDSTGLGVLVGGLKRFREHGGSLAPVVTKSSILKIFQITGLTSVLPPRSSVEEADRPRPALASGGRGQGRQHGRMVQAARSGVELKRRHTAAAGAVRLV